MKMNPKYPVYIISKGRWESRLTSKALEEIKVPYHIVVEPQEYLNYAEVIDADNFKVKDSTTSSTSGAVTIKTNYLYNINDADLQTLTLNDYTYITNRTKVTAMKDLLAGSYDGENNYNGVRQPEAFVELKKVSYASQYAINLFKIRQ